MASPQMLLDTLTANDEAEFKKSPAEFCSSRVQKQGLAFSTTAFGGAVLSGNDAALALVLGEGAELEEPEALLGEPFARTSETYDTISEAFNRACYEELFEWIPKFKEQGGFSTFRFDDFLDARVRAVRPSVRRLMLRATMPLTLGVSWADAVKLVESEALASVGVSKMGDLVGLYDSFARGQAGGLAGQFSRLTGGGSEAKLQTALAALAGGGDGAALLRGVFSSVEQSTALVCNLLGQTAAHEDWDRQLAAEQLVALDGWGPQEQIGTEQLAAMPKLRAFTLETLRLLPPARPSRLRLRAALGELAPGTLLQPEPFIAHLRADTYPDPGRFDPTRFVQGAQAEQGAQPPPRLGFAGPAQGGAGAELATALAQATFVQMRRMFELRLGKQPPFEPSGFPLSSIPEGCEVLAEARMYYELKRENKKLRF